MTAFKLKAFAGAPNRASNGPDDITSLSIGPQGKPAPVQGPFTPGEAVASMDTVGKSSLGTQVETLNPGSGELTPLITGLEAAKGLPFLK